jgi:hypothetical protein
MNDNDKTNPVIQDADVVNNSRDDQSGAAVISDLESLIKNHISGIDKRKNELKKYREMINDSLTNDRVYQEQDKAAKESAKVRNVTKSQLLKQPSLMDTVKKMHETAAELKEMNEALSDYLSEFRRISGSNEIETDEGEVREIIYVAKLVKKAER